MSETAYRQETAVNTRVRKQIVAAADVKVDHKGRPLGRFVVEVDGTPVGMVWAKESRHPRLSGRIEVGCSYSIGWTWSTRVQDSAYPSDAVRLPSGRISHQFPKRTRAAAVEALVAEYADLAR